MTSSRATLTQLVQQAAAQIGFTVRRWWRDAQNPSVLCVEVERRRVGARPAIAELTVAIPFPSTPRPYTLGSRSDFSTPTADDPHAAAGCRKTRNGT